MNNAIKNLISFTKSIFLQLSIIIVNFNVKFFLEQCLSSVTKACRNIEAEIIVIDNNSTDGSRLFFEGRFNNVLFIWNSENMGFSRANNRALTEVSGEYILFLNPDTILPGDCLEKCLDFFSHNNNIGATGIRMIDGSSKYLKESKRGVPSPFTSLFKLAGLTALFPSSKIFARYYLGNLDQNKNQEVDILAGAFMMVKKTVLDKTGSFDERFFLYGEDVDLSYRIQKAGFKNYYFSESTIIHFKGESMQKGSLDYVRLFYGAMSLFVKKHYGERHAGFYNFLIRIAIWLKAISSYFGYSLKKVFGNKKEPPFGYRCLVIADSAGFDFIKTMLLKTNFNHEIIVRIDPKSASMEDTVGNFADLSAMIAKNGINEIIFCLNGFPAKEMISLIQKLPAGIIYRFHFNDTFSIVGSKNKKTPGDSMALNLGAD